MFSSVGTMLIRSLLQFYPSTDMRSCSFLFVVVAACYCYTCLVTIQVSRSSAYCGRSPCALPGQLARNLSLKPPRMSVVSTKSNQREQSRGVDRGLTSRLSGKIINRLALFASKFFLQKFLRRMFGNPVSRSFLGIAFRKHTFLGGCGGRREVFEIHGRVLVLIKKKVFRVFQ